MTVEAKSTTGYTVYRLYDASEASNLLVSIGEEGMRLEDRYTIAIGWSDADECYGAHVCELPFTSAHGNSFEEALANARDAIASTLEVLRETGKPIPEPQGQRFDPFPAR
jgi:antitoxin HicB